MFSKYISVKQRNQTDCGPAALLMIIKYYGGNTSLVNLRVLCNTNSYGTSAYDLIKAAKQLKFNTLGVKVEKDNLKQLKLPCIAHVLIDQSYYHYLVIYEINFKRKYIIVGDPAKGIIKLTFEEYFKISTNNYILLKPYHKLIKEDNLSIFKYQKDVLINNKKAMIIYIIMTLIMVILTVISSYFIRLLIENNITIYNETSIKYILIINTLLLTINRFIYIIKRYFNNTYNYLVSTNIYQNLSHKLFNLNKNQINSITTPEMMTIISEIDNYQVLSIEIFNIISFDLLIVIIMGLLLGVVFKNLYFEFLLYLMIGVIILIIYNLKIAKKTNKFKKDYYLKYEQIMAYYEGLDTLRLNNVLEDYNEMSNLDYQSIKQEENKLLNTVLRRDTSLEAWQMIFLLIMNYLIINLIIKDNLSINSIFVFQNIFYFLVPSLTNLSNLYVLIKELKLIQDKLNINFSKNKRSISLNESITKIKYHNFKIKYDEKLIINNFNYEINKNDYIYVQGKSGTGKTSLFKSLHHDEEINVKTLYLNDTDITLLNNDCLVKQIRYVSDTEKLFQGSIYENITLNQVVDQKLLLKIIKVVGLDKIYDGNFALDSLVLVDGTNISQGERQRIILARALLREFDVLILDEATIHLDLESELQVLNYLKQLNKIIIFISHRKPSFKQFTKELNLDVC